MKVCLAGTYGRQKMIEEVGLCDYVLESFWYIKEWQIEYIKKCKFFLLDSGAFSMFLKGHKLTEDDWNNYVTRYINFINKYDIKYFFELDIDRIVGIKKVEEIRERIERETGKKCIPVWHKERGWEYFKKMCEDYDYVAIGGIARNPNGKQIEKLFPYFINYAHKKGCKIHGLGYTNIKGLKKYHFDSVDSTAWSSGWRFGMFYKFNGKGFDKVSNKEGRIKKSRAYEVDTINYINWVKFQKYADKYL